MKEISVAAFFLLAVGCNARVGIRMQLPEDDTVIVDGKKRIYSLFILEL